MADYTVKIQNSLGETLQLCPSGDYILAGMTGITPADAVINAVEMPTVDGARFNNSRVGMRTITITLKVRGEGAEVRRRRVQLYRYAKPKHKIRVYIANDQRDVVIDGYLESLQDAGTVFSDDQRLMLSVICLTPYFRDNAQGEQVVRFGSTIPKFVFPFGIADPIPISVRTTDYSKVIMNDGDAETGVILTVKAIGNVEDPIIYNQSTGETMSFDISMVAGDELVINTIRGEKSVKRTRSGNTINVLNLMTPGSGWIELETGGNQIFYSAASGVDNIQLTFAYNELYGGL